MKFWIHRCVSHHPKPLTILSTQYLHSCIQRKSVIYLKTTSPFLSAVHRFGVNLMVNKVWSSILETPPPTPIHRLYKFYTLISEVYPSFNGKLLKFWFHRCVSHHPKPLTILSTQYLHSYIQRKSVISLKTTSPFISAVHRYGV